MTARPKRSPAPELPAFDKLDATHARIVEQLDRFEKLLEHLDEHGLDAEAEHWAREMCDFFAHEARQHHAEEEKSVFPGLLKSGDARIVHEVKRLQQDHGWLEEDWIVLQPQLQAIADGLGSYDIEMLRAARPVFDKLYREHIALEESMIYPAAKRQQAQAQKSKD